MKIRTLQLIGGAGRGACCLLGASPPVPVSASYLPFYILLWISFFSSTGSSSAQMTMMDNYYCSFFLLFCSPSFSIDFFLWETSFEKNILKKYHSFIVLLIQNIDDINFALSVISLSRKQSGHFENKFSRYWRTGILWIITNHSSGEPWSLSHSVDMYIREREKKINILDIC